MTIGDVRKSLRMWIREAALAKTSETAGLRRLSRALFAMLFMSDVMSDDVELAVRRGRDRADPWGAWVIDGIATRGYLADAAVEQLAAIFLGVMSEFSDRTQDTFEVDLGVAGVSRADVLAKFREIDPIRVLAWACFGVIAHDRKAPLSEPAPERSIERLGAALDAIRSGHDSGHEP